ncbi:hypothetical protein [Allorhizocola rhizosphaerae]|uniref:hypothetical protein n=1 Tax=Allorhizocola rhizosphaerae TaxID=1872709 RepID=UPI000E3EB70E|nr:hypothetical protein [Allorhizocola rhizosphaerae]
MADDWVTAAADIFSAVGTVGAFVIGFVLLRGEHRREADRAEDERRAQAARISAWVEAYRKPDGGREIAFHIHNASDMPIYEVEVPLPTASNEEQSEFIGLVPPGQTVRRAAPTEWLRSYVDPEPVQIEFLDSAGRRWTRDEQGKLARTEPDD